MATRVQFAKRRIFRALHPVSVSGRDQWIRVAMYRALDPGLTAIAPDADALEVSGDGFASLPWRSYESLWYPAFDVCATDAAPTAAADVVIADQVLEHVSDPWAAVRTLFAMCRPGGRCVVTTPFLYRVHRVPEDYWRFTPDGLARLFEGAGFAEIETGSWGNWQAVLASMLPDRDLAGRSWLPMRNDRDRPVIAWAVGRSAL